MFPYLFIFKSNEKKRLLKSLCHSLPSIKNDDKRIAPIEHLLLFHVLIFSQMSKFSSPGICAQLRCFNNNHQHNREEHAIASLAHQQIVLMTNKSDRPQLLEMLLFTYN